MRLRPTDDSGLAVRSFGERDADIMWEECGLEIHLHHVTPPFSSAPYWDWMRFLATGWLDIFPLADMHNNSSVTHAPTRPTATHTHTLFTLRFLSVCVWGALCLCVQAQRGVGVITDSSRASGAFQHKWSCNGKVYITLEYITLEIAWNSHIFLPLMLP